MNIGFVVHYYDRREGTGGYAVELVSRLAASHDVTLYAGGVHTDPPPGVTLVRVPALRVRAITTMLTFPWAYDRVRRDGHDVVHAQGWVAPEADVVTAHIVLSAWSEEVRVHDIPRPMGERLFGRLVAKRETELLATAGAVIAPSRRTADDVRHATGRTDNVIVVPHGCERAITLTPRAEARKACRLKDNAFVAAYIGDARKGLRPAIAALVRAEHAYLLILSRSDPAPYFALGRTLGVADRMCWAPGIIQAADAFGAADVMLLPTIYDTFGMVVGEALALGIPVIVSARAGAAELIDHRKSGWILGGVTADETGGALLALSVDGDLRRTLAEGGRKVAERWTWDETVRRTVAVYERVRRK